MFYLNRDGLRQIVENIEQRSSSRPAITNSITHNAITAATSGYSSGSYNIKNNHILSNSSIASHSNNSLLTSLSPVSSSSTNYNNLCLVKNNKYDSNYVCLRNKNINSDNTNYTNHRRAAMILFNRSSLGSLSGNGGSNESTSTPISTNCEFINPELSLLSSSNYSSKSPSPPSSASSSTSSLSIKQLNNNNNVKRNMSSNNNNNDNNKACYTASANDNLFDITRRKLSIHLTDHDQSDDFLSNNENLSEDILDEDDDNDSLLNNTNKNESKRLDTTASSHYSCLFARR